MSVENIAEEKSTLLLLELEESELRKQNCMGWIEFHLSELKSYTHSLSSTS